MKKRPQFLVCKVKVSITSSHDNNKTCIIFAVSLIILASFFPLTLHQFSFSLHLFSPSPYRLYFSLSLSLYHPSHVITARDCNEGNVVCPITLLKKRALISSTVQLCAYFYVCSIVGYVNWSGHRTFDAWLIGVVCKCWVWTSPFLTLRLVRYSLFTDYCQQDYLC